MNKEMWANPGESAVKALVILALGPLSSDNGLPGFKISTEYKYPKLQSGNIIGALDNTPQHFAGKGGGYAHISIWICTAAASQEPSKAAASQEPSKAAASQGPFKAVASQEPPKAVGSSEAE